MTVKELFEAVGLVDDDLILAADAPARRRPALRWQWAPLAACLCLAVGVWQSQGKLLENVAGLVMPRSGSSAVTAATASDEAAPEAAEALESMPDTAAAGEAAPQEAASQEGSLLREESDGFASKDAGMPDAAAGYSAEQPVCPLDAAGYERWEMLDAAGLDGETLELSAGVLYVLTDGGEPFTVSDALDTGWALHVRAEDPDVPLVAGYAPAGGTPAPTSQGSGGDFTVTLDGDAPGAYYFYLAADGDVRLTAQLSFAVICRVAPEK